MIQQQQCSESQGEDGQHGRSALALCLEPCRTRSSSAGDTALSTEGERLAQKESSLSTELGEGQQHSPRGICTNTNALKNKHTP